MLELQHALVLGAYLSGGVKQRQSLNKALSLNKAPASEP